jgi:hypothetical protein
MLVVVMRTDFFFAVSAPVEFPTLATPLTGFERPANFVEPGDFSESAFLGFDRPTAFTGLCVFSCCAGCSGGRTTLSGSVSTASWTCILAASYG